MLLDKAAIDEFIVSNDAWKFDDNKLVQKLKFKDFSEAVGFIVKLGILAEKAGHHPDFKLHSWNLVDISLSTHSEGGITEKDVKLAEEIEKLF